MPRKVQYLVATLPFSNAYFAKAYAVERLESLLRGIESAFLYFGGLVDRVVPDYVPRHIVQSILGLAARRQRKPARSMAAHRAGDSRIDWTEPLLRRSTMGIVSPGELPDARLRQEYGLTRLGARTPSLPWAKA